MTTTDDAPRAAGTTDVPATLVETRDLGPAGVLTLERDASSGVLVALRGRGPGADAAPVARDYLVVAHDGTRTWPGIATVREHLGEGALVRDVAPLRGAPWTERYRWSGDRLVHVDGVDVRRDPAGRVVACVPGGQDPAPATHRWFYTHDDRGLVEVVGPGVARRLVLGPDGRVLEAHDESGVHRFAHDEHGARRTPARPQDDVVDDEGRTWVTYDATGAVRSVLLWDGLRCLARVDGPLGAPLAAVFSLDPSGTPVRVTGPGSVVRVPRDAFGEGLLGLRDVPGLFGGRVHAGLVHLPLRRLDPRTGTFCAPDPWHGGDDDPRRPAGYDGPVPVERDPRSAYEVCRGDAVGRADPTGGVSAGLVLSTLTWSFQNNILTFFGIDWWFNLFMSLVAAPFAGDKYDFFSSTGLSTTDRLGAFAVRRDGFMNVITGGRPFTTQHIVWAPDSEFADLQHGEVVDPGGAYEPTHYGTVLRLAPTGADASFLRCSPTAGTPTDLAGWTRHGGTGVAVAPGTLTPWFPTGGLHLDVPRADTRHDVAATLTELRPGPVAVGDFEQRTVLVAPQPTGAAAGALVLVDDGTALAFAHVDGVDTVPAGQRLQLHEDLTLTGTSLSVTRLEDAPASSEQRPAGGPADSFDARGTTTTYAPGDLVRLTATSGEVLVARVARLEARLPLERPLPAGLVGPLPVATATPGPTLAVTATGTTLDVGTATPPAVGTTGLLQGGTPTAVRVESVTPATTPGTSSTVTVDVAAPPGTTALRTVTTTTLLGSRADAAEADPVLTYTPLTPGSAPDGSAGLVVVRVDSGAGAHARVVPAAPVHDVVVLDRALVGTGPWTVERWRTTGATSTSVVPAHVLSISVAAPERFEGMPVRLTLVAGEPPTTTVRLTGVAVSDGVATLTPPTAVPGLRAGEPVLVGTEPTAVREVRCAVTFSPSVDLAPTGLRLVTLEPAGYAYDAVVAAADAVDVHATAAGGPAPFPRAQAGDLVAVTDAGTTSWHRVSAASAGRFTLVGGTGALTVGHAVTVQQAAVTDPGTGCPWLAVDGTRAGTGPAGTATFASWASDGLPGAGTVVGIVDGGVTHPVALTAAPVVASVRFAAPLTAVGVDVATLVPVRTGHLDSVVRDGAVLLATVPPGTGTLTTAPGQSVVVAGLEPVGDVRDATFGPGTLLVPAQETQDVDRGQSLANHELTHTVQYARWGPLWFCAFPMIALELPGILASDVELPELSAFLDGEVAVGTGALWSLTVADRRGVELHDGDTLQVVQGARAVEATVASSSGDVLQVRVASGALPTGRVAVRKRQSSPGWEVPIAVLDAMTHGGLVNLLAGSTWGGIFWLVGKAFYGLGRAMVGTGDLFAAHVTDATTITLAQSADADRLPASGRFTLRQGEDTVIRTATRTATTLTLTEAVAFTGDVRVGAYDSHEPESAFDWYSYTAGTVDAANHFAVDLGAGHGLSPEDRVVVRYRAGRPVATDVLAVAGPRVELAAAVPVTGDELSVRIAKVGASDPLGNADSAAMVEMGMGWMKWLFDPYGQIEPAAAPGDWTRWLLRVMRWLLGTQNFSLLPFGYLWWDRMFPGDDKAHTSSIEQEASSESGDVYSPLGRVTGDVTPGDAIERASTFVGDVVRYRYWPMWSGTTFVRPGRLDAPGVHQTRDLRTVPNAAAAGGTGALNGATVVDPAVPDPGTFVASAFTERAPDPRAVPSGDPLGFTTSALGTVPVGPRVERNQGVYAAFSRPGAHRLTVDDASLTTSAATQALEAHAAGKQTLWFDLTVADVTVSAAGRELDASAPGTSDHLVLVPFQSVDVTVVPGAPRVHRVSVLDPTGAVTVAGSRLTASGPTTAPVPVEVSRHYAVTDGRYGGGLAFAGLHLSRELDVPVRTLTVEVVTTLPVRDAARPDATQITTLARDTDAFVLVPAPVTVPPVVTAVDGVPPAAGAADPVSRADAPDAAAFLGTTGSAFRLRVPAAEPAGTYSFAVTVGDGVSSAVLTFQLTVT